MRNQEDTRSRGSWFEKTTPGLRPGDGQGLAKQRWEGTVLVSPQARVSQLQTHSSCFAPAGAGALQIPCHPCQQVRALEAGWQAGGQKGLAPSCLFVVLPASSQQEPDSPEVRTPALCVLRALGGGDKPRGPGPGELPSKAGNQSTHMLEHPLCLPSTGGLFTCHQGQTQGQDSEHGR